MSQHGGSAYSTVPPAQELSHDSRHRHDRHGFFRSVDVGQHRDQHDRGAGTDDAADGAGEKSDEENEKETHICAVLFRLLHNEHYTWLRRRLAERQYHMGSLGFESLFVDGSCQPMLIVMLLLGE